MKLVIAVVREGDSGRLIDALVARSFHATKLSSSGGFLRDGNATLVIGVQREKVDDVVALIRENCHSHVETVVPTSFVPTYGYMPSPIEIRAGGAVVFVLDVERFEKT
ncbi:MAG: cyclic-di-AMP receptor [Chloroflexi bacterium]|nr:cyclic-di-AMP receptor [Chloroflexota bacterium]